MKQKTVNFSSIIESEKEVLSWFATATCGFADGNNKYKILIQVKKINRINNGFNRKRTNEKKLKDALWKLVSEYVRRRDKGICFTCGIKKPWEEMQAGHFIPQSLCNTDSKYAEWNIHCQCHRCNINLGGNVVAYRVAMEKKYGAGVCSMVEKENKETTKWVYKDYEEAIEMYKNKVSEL